MANFQKYKTKTKGSLWKVVIELEIDLVTKRRSRIVKRGFKTKKEAQQEAVRLEAEIANSTYIKVTDALFDDFVDIWFKTYSCSGVKWNTIRNRENSLVRIKGIFGNTKIKDIKPIMYQNFINEFSEKYSYYYLKNIHAICKMIFEYAVDFGFIGVSPTTKVRIPKRQVTYEELNGEVGKTKYLEKEELKKFINVAKNHGKDFDYLVTVILAYTGMRIGELLALTWEDIDCERNIIRINKTLVTGDKNTDYRITTPKSKASIRMIVVDKLVVDLLKEYKKEIVEHNQKVNLKDKYNFIINQNGIPYTHQKIIRRFRVLTKLSGFDYNVTPHTFRHTHASLLVQSEVGVKEIQQRLGHSDIQTTLNIYAHFTKDMENVASEKFSMLMNL